MARRALSLIMAVQEGMARGVPTALARARGARTRQEVGHTQVRSEEIELIENFCSARLARSKGIGYKAWAGAAPVAPAAETRL